MRKTQLKIPQYFEYSQANEYYFPTLIFNEYSALKAKTSAFIFGGEVHSLMTMDKSDAYRQRELIRKQTDCIRPNTITNHAILIHLLEEYAAPRQPCGDLPFGHLLRKYGLPFWQTENYTNELRHVVELDYIPNYGFDGERFYIELSKLYMLFRIWLQDTWDEPIADSELMKLPWVEWMAQNLKDYIVDVHFKIHRDHLLTLASGNIRFARIAFGVDHKLIPRYSCDNYLDAALLQMLDLIIAGPESINGRTIRKCDSCGELYIRQRKSSRYCPTCSTSAARVQRYRANKAKNSANKL